MGAFDRKPDVTIPNPEGGKASEAYRKKHGEHATAEQEFRARWGWDDHEQIVIRGTFTVSDQEQMENSSSTLEGKGKKRDLKVRTGSARRVLLERMIVSWTLTKNGQIMPVTPENIGLLPANYRKPVLEACDEIAKTMDEDEQEDFLPSANGHLKEN